jgi:hypothetical protein
LFKPTAWTNQTPPRQGIDPIQNQQLGIAILQTNPSRNNLGVIQDKEFSRIHPVNEFSKMEMGHPLFSSVKQHHPGLVSPWRRVERYQALGQLVVIVSRAYAQRILEKQNWLLMGSGFFLYRHIDH